MNAPIAALADDVLVGRVIERLRRKLIDVSKRNRMLSFRHEERSRTQLRLCATTLDGVYAALVQHDERLRFQGLPALDDEPDDEKTPGFRAALAEARMGDPDYRARLVGLGEEPGRAATRRVERWLRDRVRLTLGLGETPSAPARAADHARRCGIEPDFDLGRNLGPAPAQLQTLLLPDRFEPRLRVLMTGARLAQQETGQGSLYAVFGFLEWYEDEASEARLLAPLLLQPVRIERRRVRGREVFELVAADEEGAQPNLALGERLEGFGLELPPFEPEVPQPVATWLRGIEAVVAGRPDWRIRRFLTVTQLSFARYVMYRDLDAANWPADQDPARNQLVAKVLRGDPASPEPGFADEYEVERPEIEAIAPILVKDADSSQHSAIVDAMKGGNLVVEGPPGTGKSQTITNLIANALHAGRSVLFVAEKLAALEVVKNRLDEVGLGPFCLELHSAKAGPKAVVEQLKERLQGLKPPEPRLLAARLQELHGQRRQLAAYVEAMARPAGPEGVPIHDLVWRERALARGLGDAAGHARAFLQLPWAESDPAHAAEQKALVAQLAEVLAGQRAAIGAVDPWAFLATAELQPFELNDVLEQVRSLDAALEQVLAGLGRGDAALALQGDESLAGLKAMVDSLRTLPVPAPGVRCELLAQAAEPAGRAGLERLAAAQSTLTRLQPLLAQAFTGPVADAAACLELDRLVRELPAPVPSLAQAAARAVEVRAAIDRIGGLLRPVQAACAALGLPAATPAPMLIALATGLRLARAAPREVLEARRPGLAAGLGRLRVAEEKARTLAQERDALAGLIDLASMPWPELDGLATVLERPGLLAGLMPGARAAEARVRPLLTDRSRTLDRAELAALLRRAAAWRLDRQRFEADPQLHALLGPGWGGIEAAFGPYRDAAAWLGEAEARLGGEPAILPLLRALGDWPAARLHALAADEATAPAAEKLADLLASSPPGTPASELPMLLERQAAQLEELARAGAGLGLAPEQSLAELPLLARAEEEMAVATAALREACLPPGTDLRATLATAQQIAAAGLPARFAVPLLGPDYPRLRRELLAAATEVAGSLELARTELAALEARFQVDWTTILGGSTAGEAPVTALAAAVRRAVANEAQLRASGQLDRVRQRLAAQGLGELPDIVARRAVPPAVLPGLVELARVRRLLQSAYRSDPSLAGLDGLQLDQARRRFAELDRELMRLQAASVAAGLAARRMPAGQALGPKATWTEAALINNELTRQRRFVPVRRLLAQAGGAVRAVKPCFLMSPLSVAQFLEPGAPAFDLLVMDEASQMLPEDALGSLLRARQVVVVGDPKQLPPTDFFDRNDRLDEDDDDPDAEEGIDAESILDQCRATFRPLRRLRWHYRSRHESLIAFANREHYADQPLITFPAADEASAFLGVELVPVQGRYEARVNEPEAVAVLEAACEVARQRPDLSLGIVTVNQTQRELLEEMLARKEAEEPALAAYRERWEQGLEPLILKNLENIQGDERDVILVSLVYGPNAQGQVHQRFGPIAGRHGHRRLNVLFTRARRKLAVFASLRPDQILVGAASRPGVRILRDYLRYAATGSLEAGASTGRGPDSDFEASVGKALRDAGHDVESQVGVAGYRIDLAVRDSKEPWRYLLGIECDGAAYHRARSVRDRDRLRQDVLESLGWRIHRVWSTDWFQNPEGELQRLLQAVEAARAAIPGLKPEARLVRPAAAGPGPVVAEAADGVAQPGL